MKVGASSVAAAPADDGAVRAPRPEVNAARPVDARALARHAARVMRQPAPWLHEEVARRMAERLAVLRQAPRQVLDWGASVDGPNAALRAACAQAHIVAARAGAHDRVTEARAATADRDGHAAAPWWSARRWWPARAAVPLPHESTLAEGTADLLWANMVLHHMPDPEAVFARWLRLVAVDGILMFSTVGPGTLAALRELYAKECWSSPHAPFVDMHDLGDMLVHAGFADPVMDQEVLTLTWATPAAALHELRQLGGNADRARYPGLRTPRWRGRLEQALADAAGPAADHATRGRIALPFEIVYGHAVRPPPRAPLAAHTQVALDDLRSMLRARRGRPG